MQNMNTRFDVESIRSHFPALARTHPNNGLPLVFFDGPGGTQVTQSCIDAMAHYLANSNANTHGAYVTSAETDGIIAEAHQVMADFLNAPRADEIVFGQNMTSLTFLLSRAFGATLKPGDEIILTRLDHDANFSPWLLMAQERSIGVHVVDVNEADCTLRMDEFEQYLNKNTKLVAVGCASNAVGTINDVKQIIGMAHAVGALTYLDAVHFAPHAPIDVQDLDTDFLACSAYKFWGPHIGVLYGKYERLDQLLAYKVRPAGDHPPHKFETGTQSFESQAGLIGTMQYVEKLGTSSASSFTQSPVVTPQTAIRSGKWRSPRAETLHAAMSAIQDCERELSAYLLRGLQAVKGVRIYGITDPDRLSQRAPTYAITKQGISPRDLATRLGHQGICVWDGNYYAINLTERLGVEKSGGMVRIGLTHYNTREEIDRLLHALT